MAGIDFGSKASSYEQNGLVQKLSSGILLEMLDISGENSVLDLGCGSGGVTKKIAGLTKGKVLGVDISEGMINEARQTSDGLPNLDYQVKDASALGFINEFDIIFSNSAFQWFGDPVQAVAEFYRALKPGGIIGMQAPATSNYCSAFLAAMESVATYPQTAPVFKQFKSPFLLLESAEEYAGLFFEAGFEIVSSQLVYESNRFSVEQVYNIFKSGAENGYLNQQYYLIDLDDSYIDICRHLIKKTFQDLSDTEGMMELCFTRIYLIAKKPE